MLRLQGVVVAYDAACLWAVLVCGSCAVCKMTQRRKVLFDIQDVGMGVHTLHKSQMFSAIRLYPSIIPWCCARTRKSSLMQTLLHLVQAKSLQHAWPTTLATNCYKSVTHHSAHGYHGSSRYSILQSFR